MGSIAAPNNRVGAAEQYPASQSLYARANATAASTSSIAQKLSPIDG